MIKLSYRTKETLQYGITIHTFDDRFEFKVWAPNAKTAIRKAKTLMRALDAESAYVTSTFTAEILAELKKE